MNGKKIILDSEYIYAQQSEIAYGKPVYEIINKRSGNPIAQIGYYPAWKRYVMFPLGTAVFDAGCLKSITKFIEASR